jgi:hypothetical protein
MACAPRRAARVLDDDELIGNWTLVGDELERLSGGAARRSSGSPFCSGSMRCTAGSVDPDAANDDFRG